MRHRSFFEDTTCPHCGAKLDAHMAVEDDARPEPGDISICAFCVGISQYAEGLVLVIPSDGFMMELSPDIAKLRQAMLDVKRT